MVPYKVLMAPKDLSFTLRAGVFASTLKGDLLEPSFNQLVYQDR